MKAKLLAVAALGTFALGGCASVTNQPLTGFLFTDMKYPLDAEAGKVPGPKTGKAEAQSILGWIAQGDASLQAACADGGISEIHTVEAHAWSILGILAKYTVTVTGE
jgi:hypothetical protein